MNVDTLGSHLPNNTFHESNHNSEPVPLVLAPAATGVTKFIKRFGGDADRVFGEAGVDPESIGNPTAGLGLKSFCTLFESASRNTGNGNFGLWFGNQFLPNDLGLWGYTAITAPNMAAALDNLTTLFRFHQQCSMLRLSRTTDDMMLLEYQVRDPQIIERRQDAELSLGMFLNVFRHCHGPHWRPEEIHFEHPKPESSQEHQKAFDAPIFFNQKTNAIMFTDQALHQKMPTCDLKLMTIMQICLESLGTGTPLNQNLTDRIRNMVRIKLPEGCPTLEQIADALHMSTSAIQRNLAWDGLSYTDLLEETRRNLAEMYLRQRNLSLSEIAYLLGYSELSAFSRAFRRWSGSSPRAYRDHS